MSSENFEFRGHTVRTETRAGGLRVTIDGRVVDVEKDRDTERYSTADMPYRDYESLEELVESLTASHPDFRKRR